MNKNILILGATILLEIDLLNIKNLLDKIFEIKILHTLTVILIFFKKLSL